MSRVSSRGDPRRLTGGAGRALVFLLLVAGCDKAKPQGTGGAGREGPVASAGSSSGSARTPGPASSIVVVPLGSAGEPGAAGNVATIPAGSVVLGTPCGEQPRLPSEEASGMSVELNGFDIDAYPYPNDPNKPPMTGVTQSEAKALCEARGRRLCSEVEWERACKGPSNTRYEYGNTYDAKACPTGGTTVPAPVSAPSCKSEFGVYAMHGFVSEWTSSPWNRVEPAAGDAGAAATGSAPAAGAAAASAAVAAGDSGAAGDAGEEAAPGAVVLRGGWGNAPYAHSRCAASRKGDPTKKSKTVGFRCCGGPENPAVYPMAIEPPAPGFEAVEAPPEKLVTRVRNALRNGGIKDATSPKSNVSAIWRWRPVVNEELYAVSFESEGADGAKTVQPMVVLLCEGTAQLLGRIKAGVDEVSAPRPDPTFGRLEVDAKRGENAGKIAFDYRFGAVVANQPDWLSGAPKPKASR